ncbi:MAG: choice-of-anchor Q domain-containing protein, partial [Acidimicrobiales bacterium]
GVYRVLDKPLEDSALLDAGAADCPEGTDQRGVVRPQADSCDIGAVELRGIFSAEVVGEAADDTIDVGETTTVTFTLTVDSDSTVSLAEDELVPEIDECTEAPVQDGASPPYSAGDVITWTCEVTSDEVGPLTANYQVSLPSNETDVESLMALAQVTFAQVTTTTEETTTTTTPTTVAPVATDTSGEGGALPTTGLSALLTLLAGATLIFGGTGLTRYARNRVARSRWGMRYGEPVPVGTRRSRRQS